MNSGLRRGLGIGIAVVGVTTAGFFISSLRAAQGEDLTALLGIQENLNAQIPMDAEVVDESGKTVPIGSFFEAGKPVVMFFAFYNCKSACLQEIEGAVTSFRGLKQISIGKDYTVITVGIHPKETPELARLTKASTLDIYNRRDVEGGWHFTTGKESEAQKIAQAVGFKYSYDEKKDRVIHPTGLILLTPSGRVSKYYTGTQYTPALLLDAIKQAKNSQIGKKEETITYAGCFTYDPSTGKTFLQVDRAIKLTSLITLVAVSLSIIGLLLKEKKDLKKQTQEETNDEL